MPDAIDPNAQSADANDPNAQAEKPDPLANLPNIVNSAVASQLKRALGGLDKMIADAVGKASAGAPPPQPPPAQGDATKAIDPALAKLREELDSHKRELEAERLAELGAQQIDVGTGRIQQMTHRAALLVQQRQHNMKGLDKLVILAQC